MDERSAKLTKVTMEAQRKGKDARAAQRAKKVIEKPWQVLEEEWHEAIYLVHDKRGAPWGPAEKMLARRILKEAKKDLGLTFDQVVGLVRVFISVWCPAHDKFPSMKFYWAVRQQIGAEGGGQVKTKKQRLDADEFDAEAAKKYPAFGWE